MNSLPLRPFPFPLNVGTDICRISRIYGILNSPRRLRFINRILAPQEVTQHDSRLRWNTGGLASSEETGGVQDTELWKTAAFVAGRYDAIVYAVLFLLFYFSFTFFFFFSNCQSGA